MTTPTEFEHWNRLTPEMKLDCIKHMDFLQKLHFRASSKAGKAIVETHRFDVKNVSISDISYGVILEVTVNDDEKFKIIAEDQEVKINQLIPLLAYLLRCGNIEEFVSKETEEFTDEMLIKLHESGPFRFKKIEIKNLNNQKDLYLERCTPEILKFVEFNTTPNDWDVLQRYITAESMSKIETLKAGNDSETTVEIAKMWIERDEEVGRKLHRIGNMRIISRFATVFEEKVVGNEDEEIRIKTDNPEKHILLRTIRRTGNHQMFVIPAQLKNGTDEFKKFFEDCVFEF